MSVQAGQPRSLFWALLGCAGGCARSRSYDLFAAQANRAQGSARVVTLLSQFVLQRLECAAHVRGLLVIFSILSKFGPANTFDELRESFCLD